MEKYYFFINDLLAAGIHHQEINIPEIDFDRLLEITKEQGITGLVASYLKNSFPSEAQKMKWNQYKLATIQKNMMMEREFHKICDFFEQEQMRLITYKGSITKHLYDNPYLRLMGDIDFVFELKHLKKIDQFFLEQNYQSEQEIGNHHIYAKQPNMVIEMHSTFFNYDEIELNHIFDPIEDRIINIGTYRSVYTLNPTYHLVFQVLHIYNHMVKGGAGIRHYLDIALFFTKYYEEIDLEEVSIVLERVNLRLFLQSVMQFCKRAFQTNWEMASMDEKIYQEFVKFTYQSNVYGIEDESERIEVQYAVEGKSKFGFIMKKIFPSYRAMKMLYPSLKTPILLPFYWIFRITKEILLKPSRWKKRSKVITLKNKTTKDLKDFFKKIGI